MEKDDKATDNGGYTSSETPAGFVPDGKNDHSESSMEEHPEVLVDAYMSHLEASNDKQLSKGAMRDELLQLVKDVKSLKIGADLTSFAAPASFFLPISTTELSAHAVAVASPFLCDALAHADPVRRMLSVLTAKLTACSRTLPATMRKPYNPVIGETMAACEHGDMPRWHALVEQVSHHPPVLAFAYQGCSERGSFKTTGFSQGKPKWCGNYVEIRMTGEMTTTLTLGDGSVEDYVEMSHPSLYLRGVMGLGSQLTEWGGEERIECKQTGLVGCIQYKPASLGGGWLGGGKHKVQGSITIGSGKHAKILYKIDGAWTKKVTATATDTGEKLDVLIFPQGAAPELHALPQPLPYRLPTHTLKWDRHPYSVWGEVTAAVRARQWAAARTAKRAVEGARRDQASARQASGVEWIPTYFARRDQDVATCAWDVKSDAFERAFQETA